MDELVDIINSEDHVLYQLTKSQAHAEGLLHRCVLAMLITPDQEWVLVRQSSDRQDAGQFVFPMGGHVQAGETIAAALQREVKEELGLDAFESRFVGNAEYRRTVLGRDENHFFHFFEIFSPHDPVLGEEAVEFKKFKSTEVGKYSQANAHEFGHNFHFGMKTWYPHLLT
jgi:8-oxo-dGTP pyrophosphatase MutT (NUDIX family)